MLETGFGFPKSASMNLMNASRDDFRKAIVGTKAFNDELALRLRRLKITDINSSEYEGQKKILIEDVWGKRKRLSNLSAFELMSEIFRWEQMYGGRRSRTVGLSYNDAYHGILFELLSHHDDSEVRRDVARSNLLPIESRIRMMNEDASARVRRIARISLDYETAHAGRHSPEEIEMAKKALRME